MGRILVDQHDFDVFLPSQFSAKSHSQFKAAGAAADDDYSFLHVCGLDVWVVAQQPVAIQARRDTIAAYARENERIPSQT